MNSVEQFLKEKEKQKQSIASTSKGSIQGATTLKEKVLVDLYKGKTRLDPDQRVNNPVMFRIGVRFAGDLSKYLPVDVLAAKEVIETIDLNYEILEFFFCRKVDTAKVRRLLYPFIDLYYAKQVGEKLGTIELGHSEFAEFVSFLRFLCYEPFKSEDVL